jgi:hypothetical protein
MNPEVESSRLMITRTGKRTQAQGRPSPRYVHIGRENSRVVAHAGVAHPEDLR